MAEKGEAHIRKIELAFEGAVGQIFHLLFDPVLEKKRCKNKEQQNGYEDYSRYFQGFFHNC